MQIRKLIQKKLRQEGLVADVNATIAANVGEEGARTAASSKQHVVQRPTKTKEDE